ncbi:MAG: fibronectin type protein [Gemmatimonadetes bacterium]|nr:fibronectin type protein [Gemmatimonadota bacterium]
MLDGSGTWMFRALVRRRGDAGWTDLSAVAGGDWVLAISTEGDSPDRPVSAFSVRLLRAADGASLAPGIASSPLNLTASAVFSPLIYPGRLIRVDVYCAAPGETRADADWHVWLQGEIDRAEWPDDVTAACTSLDGVIHRRWVEEVETRGAPDPGTPIEDELQGMLDRWMGEGVVTLLVDGVPDFGVGEYKTALGSLGAALLTLAQRIGWDLRYRWDETAEAYRYTLYLPPRDKVDPDLTLGPGDVFDVPGLAVDREAVRNAVSVTYTDASSGHRATVTAEDADSIADFDRLWLGIEEPSDSPVTTETKADVLAAFAIADLAQPLTEKRIRVPFLPFLTLHHLVRITPDGARFDYSADYSVVGVSHDVSATDGASTTAALRGGSPVGMYYAWRRRGDPATPGILSASAVHSPDGYLSITATYNEATLWVSVYARNGASAGTEPTYVKRTRRPKSEAIAPIKANNGTWYVTLQVESATAARSSLELTVEVSGVTDPTGGGGGGTTDPTGGASVPTVSPGTPHVVPGEVSGGNQAAEVEVLHTSSAYTWDLEWFADGTSEHLETGLAAAVSSASRDYPIGTRPRVRARYTNAAGAGPWTALSAALTLGGAL